MLPGLARWSWHPGSLAKSASAAAAWWGCSDSGVIQGGGPAAVAALDNAPACSLAEPPAALRKPVGSLPHHLRRAHAGCWQGPRGGVAGFAASATPNGDEGHGPESPPLAAEGPGALQASMEKLVDTAVDLVESGQVLQAVEVLDQGIGVIKSAFPGAPELGELHNQAALLLLFADRPDEAAPHAQAALEVTQARFGAGHALTAHRLLRLATIRCGQGRTAEAQPLLAVAMDIIADAMPRDPALAEARFYLALCAVAGAAEVAALASAESELLGSLGALVAGLGGESMIVRLALHQHSRVVNAALDRSLPLGEAGFKQHLRLLEVADPGGSPDLGLAAYQLAVIYYAHDFLQDAGAVVQRAAQVLRQHFPEDHDLMVLTKHRLGMICAAGHDARAASALLGASRPHYAAQQPDHPLALEADLGLAMARLQLLVGSASGEDRRRQQEALLGDMRVALQGMARALGSGHLLVRGGERHQAALARAAGLETVR